jgi:hypothetical protein
VPQILDVDEPDELDEITPGEAEREDIVIRDDLDNGDGADRAEPERPRERKEGERSGDGSEMRRDPGARAKRRDFPAFLSRDLFEPLLMFAPRLPPPQFFATASTASAVSLARKFSRSRAWSFTHAQNTSIFSAWSAFSRE